MNDISYGILDLFKTYGNTQEGIERALTSDHHPEMLHALTPVWENLLEWLDLSVHDQALKIGSGYGAFTGLLADRCAHVTVMNSRDENLAANRERNRDKSNITYELEDEESRSDWVFLIGPSSGTGQKADVRQIIDRAGKYLKGHDRPVFACGSTIGLRFLAGGRYGPQEDAWMKGELEAAFLDAGLPRIKPCYPMLDHGLSVSIYSDRYLPDKGNIIHMDMACDKSRYACFHEEEILDRLISEEDFGRFANGFLIVASADASTQKTIFTKYNHIRKGKFQIRTSILEGKGTRYVEKAALGSQGSWRILSFQKEYGQLQEFNPSARVLEPDISRDRMTVRFSFLCGETLAERLGREIREGKASVEAIEAAMKVLFGVSEDQIMPFAVTPELTEVFGEISDTSDSSYRVSNIDGLFENLMVVEGEDGREDSLYCLDYEQVFDLPVSAHLVQYRNLAYFYYKYGNSLDHGGLEGFLREFSVSGEMTSVYASMERAFQSHVHGGENQGYLAGYNQKVTTLEELRQADQGLVRAKDRINQLQAEVEEKSLQIRREQEVQRLTNNHVTNLEVMIRDLCYETDELGKLATYLNGREVLIFELHRKLGNGVNRVLPRGTRKRKILNYCFNTIKYPVRYGRMYAAKEGRNLINGDFEIGEDYLEYGRLRFPQVSGQRKEGPGGWEGPMVSIVTPCYNQVHYTYACFQPILEFTKDVTYGVIIVDSVPTDATAQLDQYVESLVISRNQTNQGFLRNCNHAVEAVRDKYIMFLNNDTKVTRRWLSSPITLTESDPSISMMGSKLVYPDGRLQEASGIIWSDGPGWNYGRLDDPDKAEYDYVKDVDYISGAAILLPASLWKRTGEFGQRYASVYCENSDLASEVRKAGYRIVYQPLSKVIHYGGTSSGTDVNGTGLKRYQVENSEKLKERWAVELKGQRVNTGNPNPFRARERSQGKEIILVVDRYMPIFDRDAGSKTTYQYLKMSLKKGYMVKFLGDDFLREKLYSTTLQQMGIEVLYGGGYAAGIWDWFKENEDEISYAYLNRPHIATKYVGCIRDYTGIKVIYYGHDLHFSRPEREYTLTGDVEVKREADYWKSVELTMMHKAAVSYYPSYVEVDAIHAIDGSIRAKAITAYVYDTFLTDIRDDFTKRGGLLFVGDFAHPSNADAVLWFAREIFPGIRERIPGMKSYVVGSKVTDEIGALEQDENEIIIKGFVSEEELESLYASCKLMVVPLRYGAGVKGKAAEAIYNGAPVVTAPTGAEGIPFVESVPEATDETEQFADRVVNLYQDNERCRELCRKTQDYTKEYFSPDGAWRVIEEDFTQR